MDVVCGCEHQLLCIIMCVTPAVVGVDKLESKALLRRLLRGLLHVLLGFKHCLLHCCIVQVGGNAGSEVATKLGQQGVVAEWGCEGFGWWDIRP